MRFFAFAILWFSSVTFYANGDGLKTVPKKYFDLIHTDLELIPLWNTHQMEGVAKLKLTPYFYPQREITLDANRMTIHRVAIAKKGELKNLSYQAFKTQVKIILDQTYTRQDTINLWIEYTANPDSILDEYGKPIKEEKGLYFINTDKKQKDVPTHLWTQGETQSNSSWFPTLDHPSEKHTQTIKVTYEDKYVSLANGTLVSSTKNSDGTKTDYWVQKLPHSVYLTVLVIGEYKIVKDKWRSKEVSYYMEPQYEATARPIFGRTPEMLEYFSNLLGVDFPWDKYSQVLVHDFTAGAMENTSAVTFNTMFQKDNRELLDENDDETVAHELFHHWFGDLVTCESWTHLTLNESFANYSEYLWTDYKYGKDEAEYHLSRDISPYFSQSNRNKSPLIRYYYKKPDDMFDVLSYNKGGKILHMLRNYLGDEAFFKSLNLYLKRFAYKTAEVTNLRQCFEEISGEDLYWFFQQWYDNGGHPILSSHYIKTAEGAKLVVSQKHNFDSTLVYKLPLDLAIYTGDIRKVQRVMLNKPIDTFNINEPDVKAISIDANHSLVAIKNESRDVDDWLYVLENSNSYLDQSKSLKKLNIHKDKDKVKEAIYGVLSSPKDRIVMETVKLIDKKWLKQDERWNIKLMDIARNNKKGVTRAAAITKLSENDDVKKFDTLIINALNDSSYLVENAALSALDKLDSIKAFDYAKKRIYSRSFNVLNTAFEIIAKQAKPSDGNLFEEGIAKAQGYKKIAIYINYGNFLSKKDAESLKPFLRRFDAMMDAEDETDSYSAKTVLRTIKAEWVKRDDATSKAIVDEINKILAKDKSGELEE